MKTRHGSKIRKPLRITLGDLNLCLKTPDSVRPVPKQYFQKKTTRRRIPETLETENEMNDRDLRIDIDSPMSMKGTYKTLKRNLFQDGDENEEVMNDTVATTENEGIKSASTELTRDLMPTENTCQLDIGKNCYVVTKRFKDNMLVHIRTYEHRQDGSTFPTKRGIALDLQKWKKLEEYCVKDVDKCIRDYEDGKPINYMYHLGRNYHVSIKTGFPCVDIRSWFLPNNSENICATRKGIALTFLQWNKLKDAMSVVKEFLGTELDNVTYCEYSDDHQNQEGALRCRECNPNGYLNYNF